MKKGIELFRWNAVFLQDKENSQVRKRLRGPPPYADNITQYPPEELDSKHGSHVLSVWVLLK